MALELYHAHNSTCSQKVRMCLSEKGIEWASCPVDLSQRENLTPEYLKINPNGVVPAFVHDGRSVIESTVMCEYLEEVYLDTPALSPADPIDRAEMRAWLRYIDEVPSMAIRIPSFRIVFLPAFQSMSEEEFDAFVNANTLRKHFFQRMGRNGFSDEEYNTSLEQLDQTLQRMEAALKDRDWLVANMFSIADICIIPVIARIDDLGLGELWRGKYTRVEDWFERVQARPSFDTTFYDGTRISHLRPGYADKAV